MTAERKIIVTSITTIVFLALFFLLPKLDNSYAEFKIYEHIKGEYQKSNNSFNKIKMSKIMDKYKIEYLFNLDSTLSVKNKYLIDEDLMITISDQYHN